MRPTSRTWLKERRRIASAANDFSKRGRYLRWVDALRPFRICAHDPHWETLAGVLALDLRKLGSGVTAVHHVGSIAIAGLIAKPVIDLLAVVDCMDWLDDHRGRVETLGYEWLGENGIEGRRYCVSAGIGGIPVHAHFFKAGSPHILRHIAFRDYLRAHPECAIEYAREKLRAIEAGGGDRDAYQKAKAGWIARTELDAIAWLSGSSQRVSVCALPELARTAKDSVPLH